MLRAEVRGSTQTCSRPNHNNNARVIKIVSYVQYERLPVIEEKEIPSDSCLYSSASRASRSRRKWTLDVLN